jgi:hypothetical protein
VPVETVLGTLVGAILILGMTALAVVAYRRGLEKAGGRKGIGSMNDASGNEDDQLRLEFHPDGTPRTVRIRGPHCGY